MEGKELGRKIQQRRDQLSLNQEDLAEMAQVTSKTIYAIETGKGNPSFETLRKILNVLGLTLSVDIKQIDL